MSDPTRPQATPAMGSSQVAAPAGNEETIGGLVHQLTTQIPQLIRSEIQLAQAELTQKGKRAGIGIGMFSAAGLLAFFGLGFLFATIALVLVALGLPGWAGALIVTVLLFVIAGIVAMLGKGQVQQAVPAKPERTVDSVSKDIETIKGNRA